jgi:hypothetical protein
MIFILKLPPNFFQKKGGDATPWVIHPGNDPALAARVLFQVAPFGAVIGNNLATPAA